MHGSVSFGFCVEWALMFQRLRFENILVLIIYGYEIGYEPIRKFFLDHRVEIGI